MRRVAMEAAAETKELLREIDYSEDLRKGMRADIGSTERVRN